MNSFQLFWWELSVFACSCEVKAQLCLLWSETGILSALMCIYGESFPCVLSLKVRLEKKQSTMLPRYLAYEVCVSMHAHTEGSITASSHLRNEETMSCLFQLAFLANAANVSWMAQCVLGEVCVRLLTYTRAHLSVIACKSRWWVGDMCLLYCTTVCLCLCVRNWVVVPLGVCVGVCSSLWLTLKACFPSLEHCVALSALNGHCSTVQLCAGGSPLSPCWDVNIQLALSIVLFTLSYLPEIRLKVKVNFPSNWSPAPQRAHYYKVLPLLVITSFI